MFSFTKFSFILTSQFVKTIPNIVAVPYRVLSIAAGTMQEIVVFGPTGQTGLAAVDAALKKGYKVRAFIRNTSVVSECWASKVQTVVGNVLDYDSVVPAVQGTDGVVVALGTRNDLKPTTDLSEGLKNIVKAMKATNVTKISVTLSAFLFYEADKVPKMFVDLNADHERMYQVLKDSGLEYVAVLPPHISSDPPGPYKVEHDKSPGRIIPKADLGTFLVDSLTQPEHYGKRCGIAKIA